MQIKRDSTYGATKPNSTQGSTATNEEDDRDLESARRSRRGPRGQYQDVLDTTWLCWLMLLKTYHHTPQQDFLTLLKRAWDLLENPGTIRGRYMV